MPDLPAVRRAGRIRSHNAIRVFLLKVQLTLDFRHVPLPIVSGVIDVDWGSRKLTRGITAQCAGG